MTAFEGVVAALGQALSQRGYDAPTPVQAAVLAPDLRDADLLVSAQTGSGKTVAFGLALAPTLLDGAETFGPATVPLALAVAPTRELALQVKRELEWLYAETGAAVVSCVGGMDMRDERRSLDRGAHIVVGTPGRLRDHIERGSLDTSALRAVVLDEADEMLDLGFRDDLEYILDAAPSERRTLMFSATVPRAIASLAKRYQRDAVRVSTAGEERQHGDIDYRVFTVAPNDRENAIVNVLRYFEAETALVFCATRATVNHMTARFTNRGFSVVALSGELSQNERLHALQAVRDGRARVCIATDLAARGIDLPHLDLVIHADIPKNRENLLHRSGRTGRAGRKGVCALIVPHNARRKTERLLSDANVEATWAKSPSIDEVTLRDRERLLEDTVLTEPLGEDDRAMATELLDRHGAEQVAAAFLRLHRAKYPAPEELIDTAPVEDRKRRRDDFTDGVWLSLSVGRKDAAEPRWLLPMLCRAGHITKNDIGAIRIHQNETHVELTRASVDRFFKAIGPSRVVEETIVVTRLEGTPTRPVETPAEAAGDGEAPTRRPRSYAKKTPYAERRAGKGAGRKPKRSFAAEPDRAPAETPAADAAPVDAGESKPKKKPRKPKGAPGFAKSGFRGRNADKPGDRPLRRKKPHRKGQGRKD